MIDSQMIDTSTGEVQSLQSGDTSSNPVPADIKMRSAKSAWQLLNEEKTLW